METIEQIKVAIGKMFSDAKSVSGYGSSATRSNSMNEFSDLMESSPVSNLAEVIGRIVEKLTDADPKVITEKPSWFAKFTGKSFESNVRYQMSRKELDDLLTDAEKIADKVRLTLNAIENILADHFAERERLEVYIKAGKEFLSENPSAGLPAGSEITFDNTHERFARKITNLETLLSSHIMSIGQLNLTKAQAIDMIDRFHETQAILVPVWRQHTLALLTTKNMNPEMVEQATRSHQALIKSLSKTLTH